MKINSFKLTLISFFLILSALSCDNDDECDEDQVAVSFPLKVKLLSDNGENLLNDDDFDLSLLTISDPLNPSVDPMVTQISENNEELITFQALGMDSVNFEYDGEDEFYFGLHDIRTEVVNCEIQILGFKALKTNGAVVCECSLNDVIEITLE